jgi:tRNA pseudouridine55 synthase
LNSKIEKSPNFGILNIYKPIGMTSHDVVAVLRRLTKIKQIGHTGTLDPFAQGVLPICIGKATRLIEFLPDDKEYLATVQFGIATTTYDIEGERTFSSDKKVSVKDVQLALKDFEGEIQQFPPIYSAIKVKGKKLYEYARKGEDVEITPRKVTIEHIELKDFDEQSQQAQILIKCSKGTYIRSIAHDIGKNLGVGAHLIKLVRTQAGKCRVENSVQLEGINVEKSIINPLEMLDLPIIDVSIEELEKIKHGIAIENKYGYGNFVSLVYNNSIIAIGIADGSKIKLKKVFL